VLIYSFTLIPSLLQKDRIGSWGGGGALSIVLLIKCVKWIFKGGVLYLIKVLNNTVYYLIFQFLQFYVGLCLVFFFPTMSIICYFLIFNFL
jgi:hypothetical protein